MRPLLAKLFAIDPRSLAAFRVVAGLILLADLAVRATDLSAFYTDSGAFPRELLSRWRFPSVHSLSGGAAWEQGLFVLAALVAGALIVGWHTRIATILSWYLLASLQARNMWILNSGDSLLRMLLFWCMFLPLGKVWSLDARRSGKMYAERLQPILSVPGCFLLLQTCLMYLLSAYFKYNEVWRDGDALYYAFSYDAYARPLATYLLQYPELLKVLSISALALEAVGPVLAMLPWGTRQLRLLVIAAFIGLHIGIELTLTVGIFSYASVLAWIPFLPDLFWNKLRRGGKLEQAELGEQQTSVAATSDDLPANEPASRWWKVRPCDVVCVLAFSYVLLYSYTTTYGPGAESDLMVQLARPANATMFVQHWGMFGRPTRYDGWCLAAAQLADGRKVDLLRGGAELSWEKPESVANLHPNHRWRKFFRNISLDDRERYHPPVCRYLAAEWDATHPPAEQVQWVDLYLVKEWTPLPGEPQELQQLLLHHERIASIGAFEEALQENAAPPGAAPAADGLPPGI